MEITERATVKSYVELLEMLPCGPPHVPNMTNTTLDYQANSSRSKAIWKVLIRHGLDLNVTYSEACGKRVQCGGAQGQ